MFQIFITFLIVVSVELSAHSSTKFSREAFQPTESNVWSPPRDPNYAIAMLMCGDNYLDALFGLVGSLQPSLIKFNAQNIKVDLVMIWGNMSISEKVQNIFDFLHIKTLQPTNYTKPVAIGREEGNFCVAHKLLLWKLLSYEKVLYLDLDLLLVNTIEHVFDFLNDRIDFAGVKDKQSRYEFNTGFMLLKPDINVYDRLRYFLFHPDASSMKADKGKPNGDQTFLNRYLSKVISSSKIKELSFTYNAFARLYSNTWQRIEDVYIIHFTGGWNSHVSKPWTEYSYLVAHESNIYSRKYLEANKLMHDLYQKYMLAMKAKYYKSKFI